MKKEHMTYQRLIKGVYEILLEKQDKRDAIRICDMAQELYRKLCQENKDDEKALRKHSFTRIYPGIAMYKTLLKCGYDEDEALWYVREYFIRFADKALPLLRGAVALPGITRHVPDIFMRIALKGFPEEAGFKYEFLPAHKHEARFNVVSCPYMNICKKYDCAGLCTAFCDGDDAGYGHMHDDLIWGRTRTLGRGDECCDFSLTYKKRQISKE